MYTLLALRTVFLKHFQVGQISKIEVRNWLFKAFFAGQLGKIEGVGCNDGIISDSLHIHDETGFKFR